MKISCYTSAFNLSSSHFSVEDALKNWLKYFDEVVIATMPCEDNTMEILSSVESDRVKIAPMKISIDDPLYDGKLKNHSLHHCSGNVLWQLDLDERIYGKEKLLKLVSKNLLSSEWDAFFIDVMNLWGDMDHYKDFGQKWYCHKRGFNRGPVSFAIREDGTVDTSLSDGCELILDSGELVSAINYKHFLSESGFFETSSLGYIDSGYPFVVHLGWANKESRLKLNSWWKDRWEKLNGFDRGDIILDEESFDSNFSYRHGIKFDF